MTKWLEEFADNNEDEEVVATTLGKIFLFAVVWMFIGIIAVIAHGFMNIVNWLLIVGFHMQMLCIFVLPGLTVWVLAAFAVVPGTGPQFVKKRKIINKETE